jgi:hypothetical protein
MTPQEFRRLLTIQRTERLERKHQRRPIPSKSSSKSKAKSISAWKSVIPGGAVETNRRYH